MALDTRALERAMAERLTAVRTSEHCWDVTSGPRVYSVWVDGETAKCLCTAGYHGRSCKHAALALVLAASGAVPIRERRSDPAKTALAAAILGEEG
jgi:hypothetical protein